MKEVTFIRRNIEQWKQTEKVVEQARHLHPDRLADAYTDLTADLAFAQTHYPNSRITLYLNEFTHCIHSGFNVVVGKLHGVVNASKADSAVKTVICLPWA